MRDCQICAGGNVGFGLGGDVDTSTAIPLGNSNVGSAGTGFAWRMMRNDVGEVDDVAAGSICWSRFSQGFGPNTSAGGCEEALGLPGPIMRRRTSSNGRYRMSPVRIS